MVFVNALHQIPNQMKWNRSRFLRLPVVLSHHCLSCLCLQATKKVKKTTTKSNHFKYINGVRTYRLNQMIMWDLGKKMVDNMGSNIVVNVIEPSIITIYRRKSSPQITPFLFLFIYIFCQEYAVSKTKK